MKKALVLCALTLALTATGCSWWWWNDSASNDEYNQLVAQAENEIKLAGKTGFLWQNTEKFLKDSKDAKATADAANDRATKRNEFDKAMKLAKKALKEAQLAQEQAKSNANPVITYK